MAKISYANLKLKTNTSVQTFKYEEQEIEVLQYLPIKDKYDLVMMTLQQAEEDGIYNPILLDKYFNVYLIFMYSNISFTDKQKENLDKLYDALESNGIINNVINLIPEEEYNALLHYIEEIMDRKLEIKNSFSRTISQYITDIPKQSAAIQDILNNFDPSHFQNVIDFARAANGGRDIN